MLDGLYNSRYGLPKEVEGLPKILTQLIACPHAIQTAKNKGILIPNNLYYAKIVEVEVLNGEIVKALYRGTYSKKLDITLVMHVVDGFPRMIRTLWLNMHTDTHKTLRYNYVHLKE